MDRLLKDLKAHPDFVAIALLALILGLSRTAGISSVESLRAHFMRRPAIEHILPDVDVHFQKPLADIDRDFNVFLRSY